MSLLQMIRTVDSHVIAVDITATSLLLSTCHFHAPLSYQENHYHHYVELSNQAFTCHQLLHLSSTTVLLLDCHYHIQTMSSHKEVSVIHYLYKGNKEFSNAHHYKISRSLLIYYLCQDIKESAHTLLTLSPTQSLPIMSYQINAQS